MGHLSYIFILVEHITLNFVVVKCLIPRTLDQALRVQGLARVNELCSCLRGVQMVSVKFNAGGQPCDGLASHPGEAEVFLLPPRWDASPSQSYPQH